MTQIVSSGVGENQAVRIPKEIEIVVRGIKNNQYGILHRPDSELDVHFNPPRQTITIFQSTRHQSDSSLSHTVVVRFTRRNSRFLKLDHLPDASLLVTFKILPFFNMQNERVLRVEHIYRGFEAWKLRNPLDEELVTCDWPSKQLQVLFPATKFFPKETEAIALLTFGCISLDEYYAMLPDFKRPTPPRRRPRLYFDDIRESNFAELKNVAIRDRHVPGGVEWSLEDGILGKRVKDEKKPCK